MLVPEMSQIASVIEHNEIVILFPLHSFLQSGLSQQRINNPGSTDHAHSPDSFSFFPFLLQMLMSARSTTGAASTDVSTPLDLTIVNASQASACTQMAGPASVSHRFRSLENHQFSIARFLPVHGTHCIRMLPLAYLLRSIRCAGNWR